MASYVEKQVSRYLAIEEKITTDPNVPVEYKPAPTPPQELETYTGYISPQEYAEPPLDVPPFGTQEYYEYWAPATVYEKYMEPAPKPTILPTTLPSWLPWIAIGGIVLLGIVFFIRR